MNYFQTIDFLFSSLPAYHRIGKAAYKDNLDNSYALDKYFGYPHREFKTIHIAGTNGKGSVSHMLASVLQEAGYSTGLYTSPHLKDFRERIRVNGAMIPEQEVVDFVENHLTAIESIKPSFFEMTVSLAFLYFAKRKVDFAVIETGLGGRLDSTNIIDPLLSVITNIGHDHMDLLGDTLAKVAGEKAGIIKQGVPVVIGESHRETTSVFIHKAREKNSDVIFADENYKAVPSDSDRDTSLRKFSVVNKSGKVTEIETPLGGDCQEHNLKTLFAAADVLKESFSISDNNIVTGIKKVISNTGLQGRWQVLNKIPLTICDTGHNKEGLSLVLRQISRTPKAKLHMILGFVNDKDLSSVLPMFPLDAIYYFTKASVPRALNEKLLKDEALRYDLIGESYSDVKSALKAAEKASSDDDMIFIGGSTFVVADIL
jgi:dihydrofolate synthase/folylpolyglutamate synthase